MLWSTTIALARSLSERLGPLTAGAAVYLLGGLFCLARPSRTRGAVLGARVLSRRYLLGCGSLFILYTVLLYLAVGLAQDRQRVLEVGLLNYLWPAATVLLSLLLLGRRARWLLWPGTLLAVSGVGCVMTQGAEFSWASMATHLVAEPVAPGLAVTAALSWALYSNLTRRWAGPGEGGAVEWFILATGLVLLALRWLGAERTTWSGAAVAEAVLLGAITALAYALWEQAMRKGHLLLVAACSYFTPLLSTLVSCAYLKVAPSPRLWLGCVLLVLGSLLTWRSVAETPGRRTSG